MAEHPVWLILISRPPYFDGRAAAGIDAALACGAFGQSVCLVLQGEAMALLHQAQQPPDGERNLFRQLASLPLYDIDTLYVVHDDDISTRSEPQYETIDDLAIVPLTRADLAKKMARTKHVVTF